MRFRYYTHLSIPIFLSQLSIQSIYICRHVSDKSKYVGSYWSDGLYHPIIVKLTRDFQQHVPFLKDLELMQLWAYNYDDSPEGAEAAAAETEGENEQHEEEQEEEEEKDGEVYMKKEKKERREGIGLHCAAAAVNINIWLTPDDANLDPSSGGLVVFATPCEHLTFQEAQSPDVGAAALLGREHLNYAIPYKRNRAVIFPSTLWHQTDRYSFRGGHKNRRINLTLLFGKAKNLYNINV